MIIRGKWILISMVSIVNCLTLLPSRQLDVLSEAQEATTTVLTNSLLSGCFVVFITDGSTPPSTVHKILNSFEGQFAITFYELLPESKSNGTLILSYSLLQQVKQIASSSRCMTITVISNEEDVISTILGHILSKGFLNWSAKFLLVTSLHPSRLQSFRQDFSSINGMVLILEDASETKRCGVYIYLPYTYRMVYVASWTKKLGLQYFQYQHLFPEKFDKLTDGANLVIAGQNLPPHLSVRSTAVEGGSKLDFFGPVMQLIDMLTNTVNFTYNLVTPPDRSFGLLLPNGSWNGMIGMVIKKEVDIALGPFAVTYMRSQAIDYTRPLIIDYCRILGRRGDIEVDAWSFVMPFAPPVWVSIFLTLFFILLIVKLLSKVGLDPSSSDKITLFHYFRIILQQDIGKPSISGWQRLITGAWMIIILVFLESYSGNLMSMLAVRSVPHPYQSIRDVLNDPGAKIMLFPASALTQYIEEAESGIFSEVAEAARRGRMIYIPPAELVPGTEKYIGREGHATINLNLLLKLFTTENFMDKGRCKYYLSRERFLPRGFALVVHKKNPLLAAINKGIRAITEGGLYEYWLDNSIKNEKSCKNPPTKVTVKAPLSLINLWGIFALLVTGCVISFLVLALEVFCAKINVVNKE